MITLKEVLDDQFKDVVFDKRLMDAIYRYQVEFLNRNSEHLAFFGSNLIGVHAIRFRVADTLKFYKDVVDVDYLELERALKKVTTISQEFKIISDAFNLTMMYMVHRLATSPKLTDTQKKRAIYDMALVFFYRCIAIRQSDYFHFPADPKIAQAAYAKLSNKFLIKKVGTWRAVMEYRAKELVDPKGLHYQALVVFMDDTAITYAISDSENRIRDLYKNYYKVFHQAYTEGNKITSTSSTMIDAEGVEKVREKINSTEQYVSYIRTAILDKPSFVRSDLIEAIVSINTNTSQRMLTFTLGWLSDQYNNPKYHLKIDEYIRLIVIHSFHLLSESDPKILKDYPSLLLLLKNLYLSTRSSDEDLLKIRKLGDELIKAANGSINNSLAMATRTSTILYITLRAIIVSASR